MPFYLCIHCYCLRKFFGRISLHQDIQMDKKFINAFIYATKNIFDVHLFKHWPLDTAYENDSSECCETRRVVREEHKFGHMLCFFDFSFRLDRENEEKTRKRRENNIQQLE